LWLNNREVSRRKWMHNLFRTPFPPRMNTCRLPPGIKPDTTQGRGGRAFPLKHARSWAWAFALLIKYWRGLGKLNRMFVPLNCPDLQLGFHSLDHISVPLLFLQTFPSPVCAFLRKRPPVGWQPSSWQECHPTQGCLMLGQAAKSYTNSFFFSYETNILCYNALNKQFFLFMPHFPA